MVAKWQNGQETKPSNPAAITSSSCLLPTRILNCVGGSTFWSVERLNSSSQATKHGIFVSPWANFDSVPLTIHALQNICPSLQVEHLDGMHSLS